MEFRPDFLIVPTRLVVNTNLTPRDLLVYGVCYWFERLKDGVCFASNETIAEMINSTAGSVSNSLTNLETEGFIKRLISKDNQRISIHCLISFGGSSVTYPSPNSEGGVHQMVKGGSPNGEQSKNIEKEYNSASSADSAISNELYLDDYEDSADQAKRRRIEARNAGRLPRELIDQCLKVYIEESQGCGYEVMIPEPAKFASCLHRFFRAVKAKDDDRPEKWKDHLETLFRTRTSPFYKQEKSISITAVTSESSINFSLNN